MLTLFESRKSPPDDKVCEGLNLGTKKRDNPHLILDDFNISDFDFSSFW